MGRFRGAGRGRSLLFADTDEWSGAFSQLGDARRPSIHDTKLMGETRGLEADAASDHQASPRRTAL